MGACKLQVLVHLGLNKCASTYVQHALDQNRHDLAANGVWYPYGGHAPCHYGLSKHYGFGPDAEDVPEVTVTDIVKQAKSAGCRRIVLSSEYLSLFRPVAARRLRDELNLCGCDASYVIFSRDFEDWVQSLFNQYVRTVEHGKYLPAIDDFVDQVLTNRAIDIAKRYRMWEDLVGGAKLAHYRLAPDQPAEDVLLPFSEFARMLLTKPDRAESNASVHPDALYRIGQLRRRDRTPAENEELARLLSGIPAPTPAPADYVRISTERKMRLDREVGDAYEALPVKHLASLTGIADSARAA